MVTRADVVIVGGGPAGTVAGLTLARLGASVLLVDRSLERPAIGEGLAPSATPILQELGLWESFSAAGHQPAYGTRSVWGSAIPQERDFIRSPYGSGWRLDRERFDALPAAAFEAAGGTIWRKTRVLACRRDRNGEWLLDLSSGQERRTVRASFLVDATGRARALTRGRGARRRVYDRLVAVVGTLSPAVEGSDADSFTAVEAVRDGWWYAAPLRDGHLVVGYLTDADGAGERTARTAPGWTALLDQTVYLRERVARHGYRLTGAPRVTCADSSYLESAAGDGWCAVGDAAAAHDPLSAQGIAGALSSGLWAGRAIAAGRSGLTEYRERMRDAYARYLADWLGYYALEQRWPASPFWHRRHAVLQRLLQ